MTKMLGSRDGLEHLVERARYVRMRPPEDVGL